MKKFVLLFLVLGFGISIMAQQRIILPKAQRDFSVKMPAHAIKDVGNTNQSIIPGSKDATIVEETQMGNTVYDLQTNSSTQNRMYLYDDGTMGGVWNMGFAATGFADRGTGYNYFDGDIWGAFPTARVENTKTGWPSYFPYGENGEGFVCHHMTDGLLYALRDQKGTGDWTFGIQAGPTGAVDISWPRGVTTGINNEVMHFISVSYVEYNGQANAFFYSRSQDGGQSWDIENHFFDELGPDYFTNFGGDVYEFAEPKNGTLAFLIGDPWTGLHLMKSADDGNSWDKTTIWECPFPLYTSGVTDTFYCADGAHHLAIDNNGIVHVVFGINRAHADDDGSYWFPLVDGIGYWNEERPTFTNSMDALNPYGDPGTELVEDYSLVGWAQDINNNGEWDILGEVGTYYIGPSSMPQIVVDDNNSIFLVFSSITETYNNGVQDYRHLWARYSPNGEFWGPFFHLTSDIVHIFDESVFPAVTPVSDDYIHLMFQTDVEPGMAARGDSDPYGDNVVRYMKVLKEDIAVGISENDAAISDTRVSQNYPNPFRGTSVVYVTLDRSAEISLEVTNITGQVVYSIPAKKYPAGKSTLNIHAAGLKSGIYFYTVRSGETSVTKKMMVE